MTGNKIIIMVPEGQAAGLSDAVLRLTVMFAECTFKAHGNSVEVTGKIAARERDIQTAVCDQLLRSAFDLRNSELRHRLYHRLLG